MTGPPPPPGGGGPPPPDPGRRPRTPAQQRTTGRSELAAHPSFAALSPEVGELDEAAVIDEFTADPDAILPLIVKMSTATDETLRAKVRALAPRLVIDRARHGQAVSTGVAKRRLQPAWRGGELDLDASLDAIVEARAAGTAPDVDDLHASDWGRPDLAICLLLDSSGSMTGERLAISAVAAAACAMRAPAEYALLSFARTPRVLAPLGRPDSPWQAIDQVLGLSGHGVTAMASALDAARLELEPSRAGRRVLMLLSDCRATDDVDPVPAGQAIEDLVILAPAEDAEAAREFAANTGARVATFSGVADLPAAIASALEPS